MRVTGSVLVGVSVAVMLLIQAFGLPSIVSDGVFLTVRVAAAAAAFVAVRRWPVGRRLLPSLIAAGLAASAFGDASYGLQRMLGHSPVGTWADLPYVAGFGLLFAALLVPQAALVPRLRTETTLDVLTIGTVAAIVLWHPVLQPIIADPTRTQVERALLVSYPVADMVLLALMLRLLAATQWRSQAVWLLLAGMWCWVFGSLHFVFFLQGTWPAHLAWLTGSLLMTLAIWSASANRDAPRLEAPTAVAEHTGARVMAGRVSIAIVPLAVPPAVDFTMHHDGDHTLAPFVGMVVLLALALVRTTRLLHSEALARAEVARSRRYFAKLADNSSDAVFLLDASGEVIDAGHGSTAETSRGLPAHAEIRAWAEHLGSADTERLTQLYRELTELPGQTVVEEVPVTLPEGRVVWLSARFANLVEDPDVGGVVVSLSDVT
uniref:hypothetical protein n=1 Tax=Nocardioides ferulae TaxID=2340821 RepID=UPI0013DE2D0A